MGIFKQGSAWLMLFQQQSTILSVPIIKRLWQIILCILFDVSVMYLSLVYDPTVMDTQYACKYIFILDIVKFT